MYTGTGGPDTDIGAHLMGFLAGLVAGVWLSPFREKITRQVWQTRAGLLSLGAIGLAWVTAFAA